MSHSLKDIYNGLCSTCKDVFVVPLIPFQYPETSYLHVLYADLLQDDDLNIHSISVFAHWKIVIHQIFKGKAILHYHWLEFQTLQAATAMPYKLLCIGLFKLFGGKIVWTVHNKTPHDKRFLKLHDMMSRWMAKKADKLLFHCESVQQDLLNYLRVDAEKATILAHPTFPTRTLTKTESREQLAASLALEIPKDHLLFLLYGHISHYKGIPAILEAFKKINALDVQMVIAGTPKSGNKELHDNLIAECSKLPNLYLRDHFINEDDTALLHAAADVCLFNHKEIISSGSIEMAKSYGKHIIALRKGCIVEDKSKNIYLFERESELPHILDFVIRELRS